MSFNVTWGGQETAPQQVGALWAGLVTRPRWTRRAWLLLAICSALFLSPGRAEEKPSSVFELRDGDRIVLLGGTFIERLQSEGYFETALTTAFPEKNLSFRNLGWSGDTVWGDSRGVFGARADGFKRLVDDTLTAKPTVLAIAYGQNEAFAGSAGLNDFRIGLTKLLDALSPSQARVVLIAPPQARLMPPPLPNAEDYNRRLALYRDAIKQVAQQRQVGFIDWYDLSAAQVDFESPPRTIDGLHWTDAAEWLAASAMAKSFGATGVRPHVTLDVANQEAKSIGCSVKDLSVTNDNVSFTFLPTSLPPARLPLKNAESDPAKQAFRNRPFATLKISGLPSGRYEITCGASEPIETTDTALAAAGVALTNSPHGEQVAKLRQVIQEKNALYFYRYRPQNETYLFLFRKHEQGNNAIEIPQFDPLVEAKEKEIASLRVPKSFTIQIKRQVGN